LNLDSRLLFTADVCTPRTLDPRGHCVPVSVPLTLKVEELTVSK
jgi:hypothetical protein